MIHSSSLRSLCSGLSSCLMGRWFAERVHSIAIEQLFTLDDIENFQEFHARDLFLGEGTLRVPGGQTIYVLTVLLQAMTHYDMPFIFSALDVNKLQKKEISRSLFETAPPSVAAFKMCLLGIESWAQNQHEQRDPKVRRIDYNDQYMVIVDETKDQELKKRFATAIDFYASLALILAQTRIACGTRMMLCSFAILEIQSAFRLRTCVPISCRDTCRRGTLNIKTNQRASTRCFRT